MDSVQMDGRILTGEDGQGVLIEDVKIVEVVKTNGDTLTRLVISGKANAYLNNPRSADDGTTPMDSDLPCEEGVYLDAEDKQNFYDKLNRHFKVDPPLVDNEENLFRLVEGGDAYEQIRGQKVYFRYAHQKGSETSPYGARFYTNLTSIPKSTSATADGLKAVLARLREKQAAQERAQEEADKALESVI